MSAPISIAIAGVTGTLGKLIAKYLLSKSHVTLHGLARTPSKLPEEIQSNPRFKAFTIASAYDKESLIKAVSGCNIVICTYLGDNEFMVEAQKALIDAAVAANVSRYMASDYSLDYRPLKMGDLPPKDPMKVVQAYLESRKSEIQAVHVLNGAFMEVFFFPGTFDKDKYALKYWGSPAATYEMTTYADSAAYAGEIALDTSAHGFILLRGDLPTYKQAAAAFEEAYGSAPDLICQGSLDGLYKDMKEKLQKEPENVWGWMISHYVYWLTTGELNMPEDQLANSRYPAVKPTTLKQYLRSHSKEELGAFPVQG